MKADVLCARLAQTPILPDGNKRVAFSCLRTFLDRNRMVRPPTLTIRLVSKQVMAHPGGVSQTPVYDPAGQLISLVNAGPAGVIRSYGYTRDT
jgi:hypothetical protein